MPIVTTESMFISGKSFVRKVKCNSKGRFSCNLPAYIQDELGLNHEVDFKDMSECIADWNDKVNRYNKSSSVTTKVICFGFEKDISFSEGLSLSVSANVFEEKATTQRSGMTAYKYSRVNNDLPLSITRGFTTYGSPHERQIPWTQESEDFFIDLANAMSSLSDKLEDMSSSPVAMMKLISSGYRLLESPIKT